MIGPQTAEEDGDEARKLDSDSDSEIQSQEQQYFDQYMQSELERKVSKKKTNRCGRFFMGCCLGICFFCVVCFLVVMFDNMIMDRDRAEKPIQKGREDEKTIKNVIKKEQEEQNKKKEEMKQIQKHFVQKPEIKIELPELNQTVFLEGTYFSNKNIRKETNHWFAAQNHAICIPDYLVNSASEIGQHLYVQATPYQNVNVVLYKVNIPAQNTYSSEPARQFMANMSAVFPHKTVVFDHQNPLPVVLSARYYQKGFFVTETMHWPLLEQNLIVNDLYLLASLQPREQLLASSEYKVLVTGNLTLLVDLLVFKKREAIVLIDFTEPTSIETAFLLKMKVYKLSEGFQCDRRTMDIFEEGSWRINERAFLVPGWYVFTNPDYDLSFGSQHKNYEYKLVRKEVQCLKEGQMVAHSGYFRGNKMHIDKMAYSELYLFDRQKRDKLKSYREVYGHLSQKVLEGSVYLDSGPLQFLLAAVASLPQAVPIKVNQNYLHLRMFFKHLVVNSLEKVRVAFQNETSQYQMMVTNNQENIESVSAASNLYLNEEESDPLLHYQYTKLLQSQCAFPRLRPFVGSRLARGLYLVEKVK